MVNSIDPDQMPLFVESDLGLHCLLRPKYLQLLRYIIKTEVTPIYIFRLSLQLSGLIQQMTN